MIKNYVGVHIQVDTHTAVNWGVRTPDTRLIDANDFDVILFQIYYGIRKAIIIKYRKIWQSYWKNKMVQFFLPHGELCCRSIIRHHSSRREATHKIQVGGLGSTVSCLAGQWDTRRSPGCKTISVHFWAQETCLVVTILVLFVRPKSDVWPDCMVPNHLPTKLSNLISTIPATMPGRDWGHVLSGLPRSLSGTAKKNLAFKFQHITWCTGPGRPTASELFWVRSLWSARILLRPKARPRPTFRCFANLTYCLPYCLLPGSARPHDSVWRLWSSSAGSAAIWRMKLNTLASRYWNVSASWIWWRLGLIRYGYFIILITTTGKLICIKLIQFSYCRPRRDVVICLVASVCLSVCRPCLGLTFERLDLQSLFLVSAGSLHLQGLLVKFVYRYRLYKLRSFYIDQP